MKKPLNFFFITLEGGGNIPPVLGLAKRLAARGHRVRVLTEPCLRCLVESLGLEFLSFKAYFTREKRTEDIFKDWTAPSFKDPSFDNVVFGSAATVAREVYAHLQAAPADVLLTDVLLPAGLIPAEALKIPRVVLFHMPEYIPGPNRPPGGLGLTPGKGFLGKCRDRLLAKVFYRIMNGYLPRINRVRKQYGLPEIKNITDLFHQADLRLIQTSQYFDFPLRPLPGNVYYAGPVLDDPDWAGEWVSPWPAEDIRPLVVVSLSSTFQNQRNVIEKCIRALGDLSVRGFVTLGPAMITEQFTTPGNVVLTSHAPHSQIFPQADLVITHAGHGTVMRALSCGVPLLCLPMGRDQGDNAAKVAYHGAGLRLSSKANARSIQRAISKVLTDQRFRENAGRLKAHIIKEVKEETTITMLEGLA